MTNKHLFTLVYIELNLVWTEYLIEKLKMYSEPKSCTPNVFFFLKSVCTPGIPKWVVDDFNKSRAITRKRQFQNFC